MLEIAHNIGRGSIERLYEQDWFVKMRQKRANALISGAFPEGLNSNTKVLEIGTGKGDMFRLLSENMPHAYSLDIDDQVVPQNRSSNDKRTIADGAKLPFQSQTFGTVLICSVLHHIPSHNIPKVLKESLRVGEHVVVVEDSIDKPIFGSIPLREQYVKKLDTLLNITVPGGGMVNQQRQETWTEIFKEAGARVDNVHTFEHPALGILPFSHIVFNLSPQDF